MKLVIIIPCLVLALGRAAFAQEVVATAPPPTTIGVDALAIMPVGDYADVASLGFGVAARLEVPAGAGFITGRLGAVFHALASDVPNGTSLTLVPVYVGYRYPLGASGAYLAGEAGLSIVYATIDTGFGRMSDSDTELGLALMAGLRRGALDLRGGLFAPDADDAVGLMASAGYDFAAF